MSVVVVVPMIEGQDRYENLVKLQRDGWTFCALPGHDPALTHADVTTEAEAKARLARIGLDPELMLIMEKSPKEPGIS